MLARTIADKGSPEKVFFAPDTIRVIEYRVSANTESQSDTCIFLHFLKRLSVHMRPVCVCHTDKEIHRQHTNTDLSYNFLRLIAPVWFNSILMNDSEIIYCSTAKGCQEKMDAVSIAIDIFNTLN